jgi:hypothetical protein
MRVLAWVILALVMGTSAVGADVFFVEEVINPGLGKKKKGSRKTIKKVYIKGKRQTVESRIEADSKTAKALKKQGQPLLSSLILHLDQRNVYEVDLDKYTYIQAKVPPVAKAAAKSVAKPKSNVRFQIKPVPKDTLRIAGVLCSKVVAKMSVGYNLDPKTKKYKKENRYIYTVWLAKNFAGYREIKAFQDLHKTQTSYPALIDGGIAVLADKIEDYQRLADELKSLEGFPMRSSIVAEVFYSAKKKTTEVFRLERQITSYRHAALPDSVFQVSDRLTRLQDE